MFITAVCDIFLIREGGGNFRRKKTEVLNVHFMG